MNILKTALVGAMISVILTGCGCSTQENYDNTVATHTPGPTHSAMDEIKDDAGNMMDDAGNAVENVGEAVGDAARDMGNAVR